jgi:ribonuclease HI
MVIDKKVIEIYTDGACSGNPGPGGWGAVLLCDNHKKEISGSQAEATNNQMELMAIIKALEAIKKPSEIIIYTDSVYAKDGITKWIVNWKKNGWRTANKRPVKNMELWQELDSLVPNHQITWKWVKGHNGNKYNELADLLATSAVIKPLR